MAMDCLKITKKRLNGILRLLNKEALEHSPIWVMPITKDKVSHKTTSKQFYGFKKPPNKDLKKLKRFYAHWAKRGKIIYL